MKVRDVFKDGIERHIAPVVYFHQQEPAHVAAEAREYIFTPGIHDQMVNLLRQLQKSLADATLADLPASWISGFYGSGKSGFAKLVGLALGGFQLPDGRPLMEALIARDDTPNAPDLRKAFGDVQAALPAGALAVVFDIGGQARDNEHVDKVALRCLRAALGYCPADPVAIEEMKLEAAGQWELFQRTAAEVLNRPWSEASADAFPMEDFSEVMNRMFPTRYAEPMTWHYSHTGRAYDNSGSMADSIAQLKQLQDGRAAGKHIFFVIDEVSQYIIRPTYQAMTSFQDNGGEPQDPKDRMLRLQTFISALGQRFRGRVWLFALGQEQLEIAEKDSPLGKMRDRFPPHLRVHLDPANIQDVVKRRLLRKGDVADGKLRKVWKEQAPRLKLYGWVTGNRLDDAAAESRFVDTYPLLPDHINLLLEISTGLRNASQRVQTDAASVRGLMQLVQELFRQGTIGDAELPTLLTLDQVYEVQRSGLPNDQSLTMTAIIERFSADTPEDQMRQRVAKAVVLLGYQRAKVTGEMVAKLLYLRAGDDAPTEAVNGALERLKEDNFLTFSEEKGFRLQDAAGQEWNSERQQGKAGADEVAARLLSQVADLFTVRAKLDTRMLPLELIFSAGSKYVEHRQTRREDTTVPIDLRFTSEPIHADAWVRQSADPPIKDRFLWLVPFQTSDPLFVAAQEVERSDAMVKRYTSIGVSGDKRYLLNDEEKRRERLAAELKEAVKSALYRGAFLFRGSRLPIGDHRSIEAVVGKLIEPKLRDLYPYYRDFAVTPRDMEQLLANDIPAGSSEKFFPEQLGLLKMDAGRPGWHPEGEAPKAILRHIDEQKGVNGGSLLQFFARPPYGYAPDIVRACLLALFRGEKVVIISESQRRLTSYKEEGARDHFLTDRPLKNAHVQVRVGGKIGARELNAIRNVLETCGKRGLTTDRDALTDAIFDVLADQRKRLREVEDRLRGLPQLNLPLRPEVFATLTAAMDQCGRVRGVEPTLETFHGHLATFQTGFGVLKDYHDQLTDEAIKAVKGAAEILQSLGIQLGEVTGIPAEVQAALTQLRTHLEGTRPWRDHADLDAPGSIVTAGYRADRTRRAAARNADAEGARETLKREVGFERLAPEQASEVLAPLFTAGDSVDLDAVAPSLRVLDADWPDVLRRADVDARARLHRALHPHIPVHDVPIRAKVLKSPEDVETYVGGLRTQLLDELGDGRRHVRVKVTS